MSVEKLTQEEYRRLVAIMANMRAWQSIEQRQVNMRLAGLERFIGRVNLDLDAQVFSGALIAELQNFGRQDGEPVTARLVRHVRDLLGECEDRAFLDRLLGQHGSALREGAPLRHSDVSTLLFVSANPRHDLKLDREMREVDRAIQSARYRDKFKLEKQTDLHLDDWQKLLLRFKPCIVHFSGHGDDQGSIVVTDNGRLISVPISALRDLFGVLRGTSLVVLNSCFSQPLAEALSEVVDVVVGTSDAIGDDAAIEFAKAFYQGLANGASVHTSFSLGVNALDLRRYADSAVLKPFTRAGIDAAQVFFC
jgi:hypothetical protein